MLEGLNLGGGAELPLVCLVCLPACAEASAAEPAAIGKSSNSFLRDTVPFCNSSKRFAIARPSPINTTLKINFRGRQRFDQTPSLTLRVSCHRTCAARNRPA